MLNLRGFLNPEGFGIRITNISGSIDSNVIAKSNVFIKICL